MLSVGETAVELGASVGVDAHLGDGDPVDRGVELAVAGATQAVSFAVA